MITNLLPTYSFDYENTKTHVYHAKIVGEGLPKHEHTISHLTYCVQGKCAIRKENLYLEIDKYHTPVKLKANEWHSIEAIEPDSIFINVFPSEDL